MSHRNLVFIDQLLTEKSLFKQIIEILANIFFRVLSAMVILVVHNDTLYYHIGMVIGYLLVYYLSFYCLY